MHLSHFYHMYSHPKLVHTQACTHTHTHIYVMLLYSLTNGVKDKVGGALPHHLSGERLLDDSTMVRI